MRKTLQLLKITLSLVIICSLSAFTTSVWAQKQLGVIRGTVKTNDGQTLPYATVMLKDTRYGIMSNENGTFKFEAPSGNYTLIVTYAGYVATEKKVTIKNGEETDAGTLVINSAANQLREVVVADIQKNKFSKKQTSTVARMPISDLENPQVYSVVTKELMQEQIAVDFNSAVSSVPGVVVTNGVNDSGNDVTLRGFRSAATFRNGLVINPRTQQDIFNVEKVEVLKGPVGTLFGGALSTYGGVVNTVTKRPFESFRGEVGYTTGSWGLNRFTADINTPLNADRTALVRINAAAHTQNSFQDAGYLRSVAFAASMAFKTSENTTVRFDADVYSGTKNLNAYIRSSDVLTVSSISELSPALYDRSLTSDDIGTPRSTMNALAEIEHKISEHWTSRTTYQHGESGEKNSIFFVPYYVNTAATIAANGVNNTIQRRFRVFDNYQLITDNIQQNFNGDFKIGNIRNRVVLGADFFSNTTNSQSLYTGTSAATASVFSVYDVVSLSETAAWPSISKSSIQSIITNAAYKTNVNVRSNFFTFSAYASDVVNITEQLIAMASLRVDRYENKATLTSGVKGTDAYTQVQYSPKFGLVYQPVKDVVSVFANYSNGFTNVAPSFSSTTGVFTVWKPQQAFQTEGGVKLELLDGKLNSTITYYDIKVKDMVRTLADGTAEQDGNQNSKGFEMDLIANPVKGLNLVFGYAYNDNKYTLYNASYQDKRTPWTPANVFNAWASYKFLDGKIKGLGLGGGVNYVDKVYMEISNKVTVPAYTTIGATLFYDQPKYRMGLKVNNLADKRYWSFYGQPQNPRQVIANISYKF